MDGLWANTKQSLPNWVCSSRNISSLDRSMGTKTGLVYISMDLHTHLNIKYQNI